MLNEILTAIKAVEGAEEFTVTVTTVTVRTGGIAQVVATTRRHADGERSAAPAELSHSHRAVLAAVNSGYTRPRDIEKAVGLKHRRVADLLKDLVESGHLIQPRYGRYQAAA